MTFPHDAGLLIALLEERQPRTSKELAPLLGIRPRDLPTIVGWITENTEIVIISCCTGAQEGRGYSIFYGDDIGVVEALERRAMTQLRHIRKRKAIILGRKMVVQGKLPL